MLVGLELEFEEPRAVLKRLLLLFHRLEFLLRGLVLALQAGDQLLELHATDLWLQLLRELVERFVLLLGQVDDDQVHEVNQEDCGLHDVLLRLRQTLGGVPAGLDQEEVVKTTIQVSVKLAQVLSPVALGDAVSLPLVIPFSALIVYTALPLLSAQLQWRLTFDILGRNKGQDFRVSKIAGLCRRLLRRERLMPGAIRRTCGRWHGKYFVGRLPGGFGRERVPWARGTRRPCRHSTGSEGIEWIPEERVRTAQRRQFAVLDQVRALGREGVQNTGFTQSVAEYHGRISQNPRKRATSRYRFSHVAHCCSDGCQRIVVKRVLEQRWVS